MKCPMGIAILAKVVGPPSPVVPSTPVLATVLRTPVPARLVIPFALWATNRIRWPKRFSDLEVSSRLDG